MEFKPAVIIEVLSFIFLEYWTLSYFLRSDAVVILIMTMTISILSALVAMGTTSKHN